MLSNFEMVREFHEAFGQPNRPVPTVILSTEKALRIALILEEFDEFRQAAFDNDLVGVADALADLLYVVYGAGLYWGIHLDAVFAEVHRSNMTKLGADGRPMLREDGKILKGPNYELSRIKEILDAASS